MSILVGPTTLSATGGVISKLTGFTVHTFGTAGSYNFVPRGSGIIEVLVVGGGGGSVPFSPAPVGGTGGAGGGAVIYNKFVNVTSGTTYPITVGSGGDPGPIYGANGGASNFNNFIITANGGAGGAKYYYAGAPSPNASGGGGGGGPWIISSPTMRTPGGTGAGIIGYGFPGGQGGYFQSSSDAANGGGGGGAGGAGGAGSPTPGQPAGYGGIGVVYSITGVSSYYGAGLGGYSNPNGNTPLHGIPNGGLGGTGYGFGGSPGAVIIRYPS